MTLRQRKTLTPPHLMGRDLGRHSAAGGPFCRTWRVAPTSRTILPCATRRMRERPASRPRRRVVRAVDLLKGAALGLEPEHPEPDHAEDIPRGEVAQRRAEHDEVRRGGLDQIARAPDQRQPQPAEELAAIADALAEAHATRPHPR